MGSKQDDVVAFIPLRGGSKGIPGKNIRMLAGRPLAYWTVRACAECERVARTYVATDDHQIRECVESMGFDNVQVIGRSAASASDTAGTESAMIEFAGACDFGHIALIQATSPLLTSQDLDGAIEKYFAAGADSLLTVVRTKRFLWTERDGLAVPDNYDPSNRPRRQDWNGQLVENGALYMTSRDKLLSSRCRLSGRIAVYHMPEETYYELDDASDWLIIEGLLRERERSASRIARILRGLKVFCVDVDGTLTDGGMYYSAEGEQLKRFDTRDAAGLEHLRDRGITIGIVTRENSPIVEARARKLKIEHAYIGVTDKKAFFDDFLTKLDASWEELAFVGDDLNDLPTMQHAGFSACPADAAPQVIRSATYVCRRPGGHGAVREVCNMIENILDSTGS